MIDCECGASLAASVIIRDIDGDQHRCPECRRYWECCPSCYHWFLPFAHWNHQSGCPACELSPDDKTALRLSNDHPRGKTLRQLRREGVPQFTGEDAPSVDYPQDGDPVAGGAD